MKKFAFGIICLFLGVASFSYIESREKQINNTDFQKAKDHYDALVEENVIRKAINEAKSLEDLAFIKGHFSDELLRCYELKAATLLFKKADNVLLKATEVENALAVPLPELSNPEAQQPEQKLNPKTIKLLKESEFYFDKARKIVDNIPETKDNDFNYRVSFLKGVIYHRYFLIFANQENVQELFNQAVTHYKTALKYKASDIDTVINIELLIKDGKNFIGSNNAPQSQKQKMLNLRKVGLSGRSGN